MIFSLKKWILFCHLIYLGDLNTHFHVSNAQECFIIVFMLKYFFFYFKIFNMEFFHGGGR